MALFSFFAPTISAEENVADVLEALTALTDSYFDITSHIEMGNVSLLCLFSFAVPLPLPEMQRNARSEVKHANARTRTSLKNSLFSCYFLYSYFSFAAAVEITLKQPTTVVAHCSLSLPKCSAGAIERSF